MFLLLQIVRDRGTATAGEDAPEAATASVIATVSVTATVSATVSASASTPKDPASAKDPAVVSATTAMSGPETNATMKIATVSGK